MVRFYMVRVMLKAVGLDSHGRLVPQPRESRVMLRGHRKPRPGEKVYADLVDGGKAVVGKLTWNSRLCCWEFHV